MDGFLQHKDKLKRKDMRWFESLPLEIIFVSDIIVPYFSSSPQKPSDKTLNFSSSGMCCIIDNITSVNELTSGIIKVGISIQLPGATDKLTLIGQIIWLEKLSESDNSYKAGIKFIEITQTGTDTLIQYIIDSYLKTT